MLFRQLFDEVSYTYTYLIADRAAGKALLIDPVLEKQAQYLNLLDELGLTLDSTVENPCSRRPRNRCGQVARSDRLPGYSG